MQHFSKFVVDNWQVFLSAAILILTFILQLIKKKPIKIVDSVFEELAEWCINAILETEKEFSKPQVFINALSVELSKKEFALNYLRKRFSEIYPELDFNDYKFFADLLIERILCTPTKKGGCGREKEVISKSK